MLFKTTQQHEELRAKVRNFVEEKVKPLTLLLDKENEFPAEATAKLGKMGLLGIPHPREWGGLGLDITSYAIAVEGLSCIDGGAGVILSAHTSLGTRPILAFGTEAQKKKYLIPLCEGEKLDAFELTEPNAGSDAGGTETTTADKGDYYLLNGGKIFIANAPKAGTYVVLVVTTLDTGTHGTSVFTIEKGWKGFEFGDHYDKMGIRSSSTAELTLSDVKVPKENLLGKEGDGFKIVMVMPDGGRIDVASQVFGIAQGAPEQVVDYARECVQFGKPIGFQQTISFKPSGMTTKLRYVRLLIYPATEMKGNHESYDMEPAMAKQYASDITPEVTNDALQIFGGTGYLKGMEVERVYRNAKTTTVYKGTNETQRVVIASHTLGKPPKKAGEADCRMQKPAPTTGVRKKVLFREGDSKEQVQALAKTLKKDGLGLTVDIPMNTPTARTERVVPVGKGTGDKENMKLTENLARTTGVVVGSSRPIAETLKHIPLNRYVGMSDQKFTGNLYIACGVSGATQHLKGTKDALIIMAINKNANVSILKNCDYDIVGDVNEILPLLAEALGTTKKQLTPSMIKMRRPQMPRPEPIGPRYVYSGCGYEYVPELGDEESEIASGTLFQNLPEDRVCPECAEPKNQLIEA